MQSKLRLISRSPLLLDSFLFIEQLSLKDKQFYIDNLKLEGDETEEFK